MDTTEVKIPCLKVNVKVSIGYGNKSTSLMTAPSKREPGSIVSVNL